MLDQDNALLKRERARLSASTPAIVVADCVRVFIRACVGVENTLSLAPIPDVVVYAHLVPGCTPICHADGFGNSFATCFLTLPYTLVPMPEGVLLRSG